MSAEAIERVARAVATLAGLDGIYEPGSAEHTRIGRLAQARMLGLAEQIVAAGNMYRKAMNDNP